MPATRSLPWIALLSAFAAASACGGKQGNTGGGGSGGEGAIGVPACAALFTDADGACRPSMSKCPGGTIPAFQGGCTKVGILECAPAFLGDDGICRPSVAACAEGSFAVPQKGCLPIDGDAGCGTDPFGAIADDPGNLYVDASYLAGDGDGTKSKPYPTLAAALAAAPAGARVVLAAGHYAEAPVLTQPVEIAGRCPSMVFLEGNDGDPSFPHVVTVSAGPVTLRGLTISGDGIGVFVDAAGDATLDGVVIQGALAEGVLAGLGGKAKIQRSLVAGTRAKDMVQGYGASAQGGGHLVIADSAFVGNSSAAVHGDGSASTLQVTDALLAATVATDFFLDGDGVGVYAGATAEIRDVALIANEYNGLQVDGDGSALTATNILSHGDPAAGLTGTFNGALLNNGGTFTVTASVFDNHVGSAVTATGTFTMKQSLALDWGVVAFESGTNLIEDSVFSKNQLVAVSAEALQDLTLTMNRVLIEGSLPYEGQFGFGVSVGGPAEVSLDSLLVSGGAVAGVLVTRGANAKVTRSAVTSVALGDFVEVLHGPVKTAGDGLVASEGAKLALQGVEVRACARVGLLYASAGGSLSAVVSTKNQFGLVINGSPKPTVGFGASFAGNSDQAQVSDRDLAVPVAPAPIPQ